MFAFHRRYVAGDHTLLVGMDAKCGLWMCKLHKRVLVEQAKGTFLLTVVSQMSLESSQTGHEANILVPLSNWYAVVYCL